MSFIRDHNLAALATGQPTASELTADVEADIRGRWVDGDPFGDDCGEHRVRPHRHHEVLEGLRHARLDIATLLAEVQRLRGELTGRAVPSPWPLTEGDRVLLTVDAEVFARPDPEDEPGEDWWTFAVTVAGERVLLDGMLPAEVERRVRKAGDQ